MTSITVQAMANGKVSERMCSRLLACGSRIGYGELSGGTSHFSKPHSHDEAYFTLLVCGECREASSHGERVLPSGIFTFHPANETHARIPGPQGYSVFGLSLPRAILDRVGASCHSQQDLTACAPRLSRSLFTEFHSQDRFSELALEACVFELLASLGRSQAEQRHSVPRWLRRANEIVRAGEFVSLTELANEVGVSPSHLSREFRRHYRLTVSDLSREVRLEEARRQLGSCGETVAVIASRCGFSDEAHLCRQFKRAYGLTPTSYRRRIR